MGCAVHAYEERVWELEYADEGGGAALGETERAGEGLGKRIPLVGSHHEQAVAANGILKVEGGHG